MGISSDGFEISKDLPGCVAGGFGVRVSNFWFFFILTDFFKKRLPILLNPDQDTCEILPGETPQFPPRRPISHEPGVQISLNKDQIVFRPL